jgi:hypothetical protein
LRGLILFNSIIALRFSSPLKRASTTGRGKSLKVSFKLFIGAYHKQACDMQKGVKINRELKINSLF